MHPVGHAELRGKALQVVPVVANPDHYVMRVDTLLVQQRQGTDHAVEAFAALQAPDREDQALPWREPDARTQVIAGNARSEPVLVDRGINDGDAARIDAEQTGQGVAREITIREYRVGAPEDVAHQRELPAASPIGQLLTMRIDQDWTAAQPGDRPRHQSLGQNASRKNGDEAIARRQASR